MYTKVNVNAKLIGQRIKYYRLKKNLTVKQLASSIGKTAIHMHQIESGHYIPRVQVLSDIADILKIRIEYLLRDVSASASFFALYNIIEKNRSQLTNNQFKMLMDIINVMYQGMCEQK